MRCVDHTRGNNDFTFGEDGFVVTGLLISEPDGATLFDDDSCCLSPRQDG
jgi:hypothetical protein